MDESKHADIFGYGAVGRVDFGIMNNQSLSQKLLIVTFVSLLILGIGSCVASNQESPNIAVSTLLPSRTPEVNQISTATASPKPTRTKTESPIPTTTWTPLPTIEPNNIDAFVDSMNSKCELPCWGGITPGKTSELEAKHLLSSFGTVIESTSIYFDYRKKATVIDLTFKNGIVSSINLPPELTESYKLNDLLSRYGMPDDVRIKVIPETAEGTPWFFLAVFFPREGFFAIFSGEGKVIDSKVSACFDEVSSDLYLVEANKYSLEQINLFLDRSLRNILEPLGSLTELSMDQFYDVFSQQKAQCLSTTVQVP